MNKQVSLLALLFLVSQGCDVSTDTKCFAGEKLYNPLRPSDGEVEVCVPCDSGTFMPETDHRHRNCYNCSKIENSTIETLITACNRKHDAEIGCISGYYRMKEDNMPGNGTSLPRCMPCPKYTHMQAHNHTNRDCFKCETLSANTSNHATILQSCSPTSPTIFGCEEFHFRASNNESLLVETPCKPCQTCQIEVQKCGIFHDAVCAKDGNQNDSSTHGVKNADQVVNETLQRLSTDVPESDQVKLPAQTLIYEIIITPVGELVLYVLLTCLYCFKRASVVQKGQQVSVIFKEIRHLLRENYLFSLILFTLFHVLVILHYSGVFVTYTKYDISATVMIAALVTAVLFCVYLLMPKAIRARLKTCWRNVLVKFRLCRGNVGNRWRGPDPATTTTDPTPETVTFIRNPPDSRVTLPDEPSM